jgi:hypothetical protein
MSKPQESFGTTGVVSNDASIASLAYSDSASEIENGELMLRPTYIRLAYEVRNRLTI